MPVTMSISGKEQPTDTKAQRVPSTIQFVYTDIGDAILVAEGLQKGGGVPLSRDQLAAAIGLSPVGGGFSTKIATAKSFGVIESQSGKYQLTDIGFEIVDPSRQAEAKVKAFLEVELFRKAYDEFKGRLLPPRPLGLEAAFVNFGVTQKNVKAARLAFERSARSAGMFPTVNEDRLVIPITVNSGGASPSTPASTPSSAEGQSPEAATTGVGVATPPAGLHRSILGMLDELPPAKSKWNKQEQADWLDALASMFQVLYKSDDNGDVEVRFVPPERSPYHE